jgi:hypothetical protein
MAMDYDAVKNFDEATDESIAKLKSQVAISEPESDDLQMAEGFDLPGADLSSEELQVTIAPQKSDEFTCMSCFLVRHKNQRAPSSSDDNPICTECA